MINDFGKKIGGARKDMWKERNLCISDLPLLNETEQEKFVTKDLIWKKRNYRAAYADGADRRMLFCEKLIRDSLPAKCAVSEYDGAEMREQKRTDYINTVSELQEGVSACKTYEDMQIFANRYLSENFCDRKLTKALRTVRFQRKLDYELDRKEFLYSEEEKWMKPYQFLQLDASLEITDDGIKEDAVLVRHLDCGKVYYYPDMGVKLKTITEKYPWFIVKRHTVWMTGFKDRDTAYQAALSIERKAHGSEDPEPEKKRSGKRRYVPEHLKDVIRTGPDFRIGKDISGDDFIRDFGIKGGEFGNWMTESDRQTSLNYGYDAFCDLADALGIKRIDISLSGTLSIAFGSRGKGGEYAHYEPAREVVSLCRLTGAGSLAHEWGHALDYDLGRQIFGKVRPVSELSARKCVPIEVTDLVRSLKRRTVHGEEAVEILKCTEAELIKRLSDALIMISKTLEDVPEQTEKINAVIEQAKVSASDDAFEDFVRFQERYGDRNPGRSDNRSFVEITIKRIFDLNERMRDPKVSAEVETKFYRDACVLDSMFYKQDKGYWSSDCELFARAFAAYVKDKCKALGIRDDYLCAHADAGSIEKDGTLICISPQGTEREEINGKFDILFSYLKKSGTFSEPER